MCSGALALYDFEELRKLRGAVVKDFCQIRQLVGADHRNSVLEIAGGRNILADSPAPYPKVLHEEILARNPDVIMDMGEHADATGLSEKQIQAEVALWRRFPNLNAVKNKRIYPISSGVFVVPGPRVVDLAREFARMLHPEHFD